MKALLVVEQFEDIKPVSLTAEFHLLKSNALEEAGAVKAVTDTESQAIAAAVVSNIQGLTSGIEKSRETVKAPVLALGREIDAIAKKAVLELNQEKARVTGLIQAHYRAEAAKVEEERRMVAELEAKRAARLRKEAEAAVTPEEKAKVEEKAEAPRPVIAATVAPKADKMTVRKVWKHEVTDLEALYKSKPGLVKLIASTAAINAEVAGGLRECPGLRIWEDTDVTVRQ